ncbi:hypothetical protein A8990_16912 [Paenibacillus taihuensis]|uniref:WD40 repeat protein n=1 Tax=Paenibacillus taihuensis TaxID=1156355 RepID=A0A3D9PZ52_9BACL|nr:hypothetical protein [Paenibacillus taihuensis]REE55420.1 hypothetical protein A8990_16912 [Paenibacillus taihuensis]
MTKMSSRIVLILLAAIILLVSIGCMSNPRSETIIISNTEEDQMSDGDSGQSFRVSTIYRLTDSAATDMQTLGWSGKSNLIGLSAASGGSMETGLRVQQLAPPYEQFKPMDSMLPDYNWFALSPDGTRIAYLVKSKTGNALAFLSLSNGKTVQINAPLNAQYQLSSRNLKWSANSRFVSYLVRGEGRGNMQIVVFNVKEETAMYLQLTGLRDFGEVKMVGLSEDGSRALIDTGNMVEMAERVGDEFTVRYDHPSRDEESAWVNENQFAFLGADGTLFQYDCRNGELAVLLEKVDSFEISADRKLIAYTQNEKDTIFAGRLQGNNVLYQEAVYQGVYPVRMSWSPDDSALLVDGRRRSAAAAEQSQAAPETAPPARLLPFIIQFQ